MKTTKPLSMSMAVLLVCMGWTLAFPAYLQAISPLVKQPLDKPLATTQPAATQPAALPGGHPALPGAKAGGGASTTKSHAGYVFHANVVLKVNRPAAVGPSLKGLPVTIWLIHKNKPLRKYQRQLGASSSVQIKDVKMSVPVMPLVRVTYDSVDYEIRGPVLNARQPSTQIEMNVYPTTTSKPPLHVAMRHVMVRRGADGIWAHEVIALENPTERAWINASKKTKNTPGTFSLKLPKNVGKIRLGKGFSSQYTRYEGGILKLDNPINPGTNTFEIDYEIKPVGGKCILTLHTPETVKHLMVFVPEELTVLKAKGFMEESQASLSKKKVNVYRSENLPSEVTARLEIKAPAPKIAIPKNIGPKAIMPTGKVRP